jgi:uncharacterized protein (DUF2236 family)
MATMPRLSELEARALTLGPDSMSWRYSSDLRLFFGSLTALLMQVAHPTVGSGVRDHSNFQQEPWARLFRTVDWVNLTIYGGPAAVEVSERLREMHKNIKGTNPDGSRYHALEPGVYAWVHATLIWSIVDGQRRYGSGMTRGRVDQFYQEWLGLGRLLGIRDGDLPSTWDDFVEYFDEVIATQLTHHPTVDTVLKASARPARPDSLPPWTMPLWRVLRLPMAHVLMLTGVGGLPPAVRERLGLRWTKRQERELRVIAAVSRSLTPILPKSLRINGPVYLRARRKVIGRDAFAPRSYRAA